MCRAVIAPALLCVCVCVTPRGIGVCFSGSGIPVGVGVTDGPQKGPDRPPPHVSFLCRRERRGVPDGGADRPPPHAAGPSGTVSAASGLRQAGASRPALLPPAVAVPHVLQPLDPRGGPRGPGEPRQERSRGYRALPWETPRCLPWAGRCAPMLQPRRHAACREKLGSLVVSPRRRPAPWHHCYLAGATEDGWLADAAGLHFPLAA